MRHPFLLFALSLLGCDRGGSPSPVQPAASAQAAASGPQAAGSAGPERASDARAAAEEAQCRGRIDALTAQAALPGAPGFEARRVEILGRAKGEAVLYLRTPKLATGLGLRLELMRGEMERKSPILGIPQLANQLSYWPEDMRKVFLAEGYVYSESPEAASVLIDVLRLGKLFKEPEIWMARGSEVARLVRDKGSVYRYAEGDRKGDEASLLLGDRVAPSRAELFPLLHRDLSPVIESHGPERVRIKHLTERGAVAELRYGERWVSAALDDDGSKLTVGCVAASPAERREIEPLQAANLRRAGSTARLREAIRSMVDERLRFDEPLEEVGQQDGSLRPLWKWSYDHDATVYSFNGVSYQVFDAKGRPHPPQVCVDFVLDTYERAGGAWYGGSGQPRARTPGTIDFDAGDLRNRRSAAEIVAYAGRHPEMFDVWNIADEDRVIFGKRSEFFANIDKNSDRFQVGNIVVIHGRKDDGQVHYHSFLVEARDPITGFPYRLAGNAGRPRLQSWEGVMRSAPLRSVRHVVAPRDAWLSVVLPPAAPAVAER